MENVRELFQIMTRRFGFLNKNCCSVGDVELTTIHSHILFEIERKKSPAMQEVADTLGTDITTFSRQIQNLVKMGLVVKNPHRDDRRIHLLTLTEKGKSVASTIDQQMNEFLHDIFSYMTEEEINQVINAIKLLNNAMVKSNSCCQPKQF